MGRRVNVDPVGDGEITLATIHYVTANDNAKDGINLGDGDYDSETGQSSILRDADLFGCVANGNGTVEVDPEDPTDVRRSGDGLQIEALGDIAIHWCQAHGNASDGMEVGFDRGSADAGTLEITETIAASFLQATNNGAEGIELRSDQSVQCTDSLATDNRGDGFQLQNDREGSETGTVTAHRLQSFRNLEDQVEIYANGDAVITHSYGMDGGIDPEDPDTANDGIQVNSRYGGDVLVDSCVGQNNPDDGIHVRAFGTVTILNSRASHNGTDEPVDESVGNGILVTAQHVSDPELGGIDLLPEAVVIDGCTAGQNLDEGIQASAVGEVRIVDTCASYNADDGILVKSAGSIDYDRVDANQNGDHGLNVCGLGTDEPSTVDGSNFGFNGGPGMALVSQDPSATIDARGNYWGSFTGPQHPTNTFGYGNPVVDSANGGNGTIDFANYSWLPHLTGNLCI